MPTSCSSRTTGSAPMCLSAMTWMASRTGASGPMVQTLLGLKASRYLTRSIAVPSYVPTSAQNRRRRNAEFLLVVVVVVVMAARPVDVAVRQFFLGRGPHFGDLDLEIQVLARERVVTVDRDHVAGDLRDSHGAHAVRRLSVQLHAHTDVADALERPARHALDQRLVVLAVGVGRGNLHAQLVARGFACELALQAGDQVAVAVQVRERRAVGGVELL